MRIALTTLAMLLAATAAWADSEFSLKVDLGSSRATYYYGTEWYWGDQALLTEWNYRSSGLTVGVRDGDWGAHYRYGPGPSFSSPGSWPPRREYQPLVTPADSIIGVHPSDKPGYRVYIPRGLTGEKEYYGDAADLDQRPSYGYGSLGQRYSPRRHRRGYPTVLEYSYGYYPYYYSGQPLYTAASHPELGYVGGVVYRQLPAYDPSLGQTGERQDVRGEEVNVYEGDVYNYYYDGQPAPAEPQSPPTVEAAPPAPEPPAEPVPQALGARFYERLRLETPGGLQTFVLENGGLYAGPETGPWLRISEQADAGFGAFAAWIPADGLVVIFREGDRIVAAFPAGGGDWWIEPLPLAIDFGGKTTIGLVGGVPWVVADGLDHSRYVMGLSGGSWYEVGSATSDE